jgi:hypothetical protein
MYDVRYPGRPDGQHELRHSLVIGDTAVGQGLLFTILGEDDPFGGRVLREDSSGVHYISPYDFFPALIFDSANPAGHAYFPAWGTLHSCRILAESTATVLGEERVVRSFHFDGLTYENVALARGLGIISREDYGDGVGSAGNPGFPWQTWTLRGCIVGDTVQGNGIGSAAPVDTLHLWGTCTPPGFFWRWSELNPRVDRISVLPLGGMIILDEDYHTAPWIDSAYFDVLDAGTPNTYALSFTWISRYGTGDTLRMVLPPDSMVYAPPGRLTLILTAFEDGHSIDSLAMPFTSFNTGLDVDPNAPEELPCDLLLQNYPNPFNPATTISYRLVAPGEVRLEVYDILGRQVALLADGRMSVGTHTVQWDAAGLAAGVYLCRLRVGDIGPSQPGRPRSASGARLSRKLLLTR